MLNRHRRIGENPKFYRKYIGPFNIEKQDGFKRYILKDLKTNKLLKYTVNGNFLKKYFDENTDQRKNETESKIIDKIIENQRTNHINI